MIIKTLQTAIQRPAALLDPLQYLATYLSEPAWLLLLKIFVMEFFNVAGAPE